MKHTEKSYWIVLWGCGRYDLLYDTEEGAVKWIHKINCVLKDSYRLVKDN